MSLKEKFEFVCLIFKNFFPARQHRGSERGREGMKLFTGLYVTACVNF